VLIKKAAGLASGSKTPGKGDKAGKVTRTQLKEIVKTKKNDLNSRDEQAALRIVEGTARSMGIEVIDA
jgi:large subunit ribosomal protein L11